MDSPPCSIHAVPVNLSCSWEKVSSAALCPKFRHSPGYTVPQSAWSCPVQVLTVAEHMHSIVKQIRLEGQFLSIRSGMHSGKVVSGIIGKSKYVFDIWGDAVNTASRMESTGTPGLTQVSADVYHLLRDKVTFSPRGFVDVKGKGKMQTYYAERRHFPSSTSDLRASGKRVFNVVHYFAGLIEEAYHGSDNAVPRGKRHGSELLQSNPSQRGPQDGCPYASA